MVLLVGTLKEVSQEHFNEDSLQDRGHGLSKEEWENAKVNLDSLATEHGLWEALPEAIGNVAGAGIIFAPAKKVLGTKLASNIVARVMGKGAELFGTEVATEAVTQQGQHNLAVDAGLQEGEHRGLADFGESVKEVAPQTILQTAMMGGMGSSVKGLAKLGAKKGLSKPLNTEETVLDPNKAADLAGGNVENTPQDVSVKETTAPAQTEFASTDLLTQPSWRPEHNAHVKPFARNEQEKQQVAANAQALDEEWNLHEQELTDAQAQAERDSFIQSIPEEQRFDPSNPLGHLQASPEQQLRISQEEAMLETRGLPMPTNVVNGAQTVDYTFVPPTEQAQHIHTPVEDRQRLPAGQGLNPIPMPDQSSGAPIAAHAESETVFDEPVIVPPTQALPEGQGITPPIPWVGGKQGLSYTPKSSKEIAAVAHEAAESPKNGLTKPTEAQKEAGNYKLGHVKIGPFDISIENPHGSKRTGTDPDGKKWSQKMHGHYGYIKGTMGKDKDHIDVFLKDGASEEDILHKPIFVVEQVDPKTGEFDEHKIIMGARDRGEADVIYHMNYEDGWKGYGDMLTFNHPADFKFWLKDTSEEYTNGTAKPSESVHKKMARRQRMLRFLDEQVDEYDRKRKPMKRSSAHSELMRKSREYREWAKLLHPDYARSFDHKIWGISPDRRVVHVGDKRFGTHYVLDHGKKRYFDTEKQEVVGDYDEIMDKKYAEEAAKKGVADTNVGDMDSDKSLIDNNPEAEDTVTIKEDDHARRTDQGRTAKEGRTDQRRTAEESRSDSSQTKREPSSGRSRSGGHAQVHSDQTGRGKESPIITTDGEYDAVYEVWEADDVIPSHDPLNGFAKDSRYPANTQERQYHSDKAEQEKVRKNALEFDPRFVVMPSVDANNGAPVITSKGYVLGGNSRAMTIKLVNEQGGKAASDYRIALRKHAEELGLPKDITHDFTNPILVRKLTDKNLDLPRLVREFNQSRTQAIDAKSEGVSKARLVSKEAMGVLAVGVSEHGTIRSYLDTPSSRKLIDVLVDDGALELSKLNALRNNETGLLNKDGKGLVEHILRGVVIDDADLLEAMPASIGAKIDRALPQLAKLVVRDDAWNITPILKAAVRQIVKAKAQGKDNLTEYFGQGELLGADSEKADLKVQDMAYTLTGLGQKQFASSVAVFRRAVESAERGVLPGIPTPKPDESFDKLVGRKEKTREAKRAPEQAPVAQKAETQPDVQPERVEEKTQKVVPGTKEEAPSFSVSPDDLPYQTAYDAHGGTSMVPDERAKQEQAGYVEHVQNLYDYLLKAAGKDKQAEVVVEMEQYKEKFLSKRLDVLRSRSRVLSTMITGPANFNTSRNEKASRSYENKSKALWEWQEKVQKGMCKRLGLTAASQAIRSDDVNATTKLKDKIEELESLQEQMKLANKEYKRTDGDIDAMDVSDAMKERLREWKENARPPYDGRPFQPFTLRNNNANIKRYKQRLKSVDREQAIPTEKLAFYGGIYVDNAEEGRIQLIFDGKPDAGLRAQLKAAGFKWAPSKGAWQRQRSEGARYKAKEITGLLPDSHAMSLTPKEQPTSGLTTSNVFAAIGDMPEMENALDVTVLQSERDLPAHIRDGLKGSTGVRGVFDDVTGTVYLVADNLTSAEEAKAIWMHEQVGHHGLRGIMNDTERAQLLNQVALVAGKDLQPIAQRYGFDLNDKAQRQQAAEEYLAQAAEQLTLDESLTGKAKRAWAKLVTAMQKVLSKLGIVNAPNTLIEDVLANSVTYLKGLSDKRVLTHDGQRYSLTPQIALRHPSLARIRDLLGINVEESEVRDLIDSGDMTSVQAGFGLPHWSAKLHAGFKKVYDVQLTRSERRNRMFQESVDEVSTFMNGKLSEGQEQELADFVWKWDGKQIEELNGHKKLITEDGELIVNPEWQKGYETWLSRRRLSSEVKEAMLELRSSLDADLIRAYNSMNRIDGINKSDLEAYLSEMGQQHNYFPHHRYGDYYVQGRKQNADGKYETVYRAHFDAATDDLARAEAQGKLSELKCQHPDTEWTLGKNEQLSPDVFGAPIDPQAMTQIIAAAADRIGDSDHAKEVQKQLSKAVSDVIKTRGWAAHSIKRQDIEGFEKENLRRVLYDYKQGLTGWISKMEASSEFTKALGDIDAKKHPREYSYASTYVEDMMRTADSIDRATGRIKGVAFAWYLGANVKIAALNLTQNIITGVPRLSMHIDGGTGFWKAAMETLVGQVSGKNTMTDDEQQLLRELYDEDVITEGYLNEIRGKLKDSRLEKGWQKFIQVLGMPMAVAERFNRASLALAAYRAARSGKVKGQDVMDYDAAKKFADQIVRDAHFVYGKTNQPQAIRHSKAGRAASPVYTFRTFSHNLLLLWNQMARHEGKEGKIALAKSIGATAALGGVTALPMYATAMAITQLVSGSDDDWTEEIRKALPQSDLMRDMAVFGLPAGLGVTLGGSLGVEMPVAPRITAQSTPQTAIADNLGDILGIPWDLFVKKPTRILTALENENELRAVEEALPTVLKNIMQAYRLWNEGQTSLRGTPIEGERLSAMEAFARGIGFQPTSSTKQWQQFAATKRSMAIRTVQANKIAAKIVEAIKGRDYAAQKAAQAEWQAWNEKAHQDNKPWLIVTSEDIKRRLKGRMKSKRPRQTRDDPKKCHA